MKLSFLFLDAAVAVDFGREHSSLLSVEVRRRFDIEEDEGQNPTTTTTTTLAMCCDYECPQGFTNVHGTIGDTADECCVSTCEDFCCPTGMVRREDAESLIGEGHDTDTCCIEWCADYECPVGTRNVGPVSGVENEEACCEECGCNGCDDCSADKFKCQKCRSGFRLNHVSEQCEACAEEGCQSCEGDASTCDSCEPGHYFCEADRTCTACAKDDCETCASDLLTCLSCESGRRLNSVSNECESCTAQDCATCCTDLGKCDSCPEGYILDAAAGTCTEEVRCAAPHCVTCNADCSSTCDLCEDGYHLVDGRCEVCAMQHCESCAKNINFCDKCEPDHAWDQVTKTCKRCTALTPCLSCSALDTSKCDSCPPGFKLDAFAGKCDACEAVNCKTCNANLAECDSCHPGFEFDCDAGHCFTTHPTPLDGQCFGMPTPHELVSTGECGERTMWLSCDATQGGVTACFNAVMAEPKCKKDYFTYNARGDLMCGCKISSEKPLITYKNDLADCHLITNSTQAATTSIAADTITTTTCAPTTQ